MGVMQRIPSRPYPSLRSWLARVREDAGFGLIEVMVSMVMLSALSLATLSLIDKSTSASAQTRSKSLAADIAHDDLNRMRQMKFSLIAGTDYQSVASQVGADGVTYKVTSTATWATDSGVETSCTTPSVAGSSTYLRIRSSVSWPSMSGSAVVADSIMAPRGKEANRTTGSLMVKVQDRDAKPVAGAGVTVASQTLITSAAGCVYYPAIAAGQWPVTVSKAATPYNYMDSDGNSPGLSTASIVVGDVSTVSVSFDIPALLNPVTFAYDSGVSGSPKWYTASAAGQTKTVSTADNTTTLATSYNLGKVFPFSSGWSYYAGNCAGNSPATWSNDFTSKATNASVIPARGATVGTGKAYMRQLQFKVVNQASSQNTWTYRIRPYSDATYTQMTGCTEYPPDGSVTVAGKSGSVNGSTTTTVDIPFGLWKVCAFKGAYTSSSYNYAKYTSSSQPTGAYNAMPTFTGATLKAGSPVNDSGVPTLTMPTTNGSQSTDPCPA